MLHRFGIVAAVVLTACLTAAPGWAQHQHSPEKLGKVEFPTACAAAVQADFNRAVALLHSFWLDAAGKAFAGVAQADTTCGMAHWGTAMVMLGNPLATPPTPKALQEGQAAVGRAQAAGARTPRERDYIAAIAVFYQGHDTTDHRTRALAYEQAMAALAARYPDDREAAVFYALALNMTALPTDKTFANQLKAAGILERVFAAQPDHPGAAHYLIHSYDYPPIAEKGLSAAKRYATIAPAAPHALHMPSHIFTRVGAWQDSIDSNRASSAVADQANRLHALDYMVYGYLQQGQDAAARKVLEDVRAIPRIDMAHPLVFASGYAIAAIPARYAVERRNWAEAAALTLPATEFEWARFPQAEAQLVFARGLGAARTGNLDAARRDLERLRALQTALTSARQGYWAGQVDIQQAMVTAWIARAEGKSDEAVRILRAAADAEDLTDKHIVTPGLLVPARELLGELLLDLGRPADALPEFTRSQVREPHRFRGYYGAARAADQAGQRDAARAQYRDLLAVAAAADTERPELREAKTYLGR